VTIRVKTEEDESIEALQTRTTDEALVAQALAGGAEDFAPIVTRYKDAIFGVSLARLRHFEDAEDIAQQAFLEAFQRLENLKDPGRLGPWLRSIAIHRSISYIERKKSVVELDGLELIDEDAPSPHENLEQNELRARVIAAIGRLSKVQRETVTLYYISGYSQQEVAAIQEVPLGTVKYRLHEARSKLKKDMVEMVEDVLKEGAPKEDFADKVFELLCAYPAGGKVWSREVIEEIKKAGPAGEAGFTRALALPHWKTRRAAVHYLGIQRFSGGGVLPLEKSVELLKRGLIDTNLKVRQWTVYGLMWGMDVDDQYRREHFVPLLIPLLSDPSKTIRHQVAGLLGRRSCAGAVPLQTAALALAREEDIKTLRRMQRLVCRIIEAQDREEKGEDKYPVSPKRERKRRGQGACNRRSRT
jgi:RNA polymerase sigma-70 factor, ECF subfamily